MFKKIDHVEITPTNYQRTMDFYTKILGFKVKESKKIGRPPLDEIAYIELGGTVIELLSVTNAPSAPYNPWQAGYRMIAIEVENMDEAMEYLKGKGVEIAQVPVDLGDCIRGEIKDPDGLHIELREWYR